MNKKFICNGLLGMMLVGCMAMNMTGCTTTMKVQATDLMEGIEAKSVSGIDADADFINSQMRFSIDMFQKVSQSEADRKGNIMISPLSIQLALAMTANGANGDTKAEMEQLLGGSISLDDLNKYMYSYINSLTSEEKSKLNIADSIWFRDSDNLYINESFLQTNADYYKAQAYKSAFDEQTRDDINKWVDINTDGMIPEILDEINPDAIMYLVNAMAFDAEWASVYSIEQVAEGVFNSLSNGTQTVEMMYSNENTYISDDKATGFIKDYNGGKYSYAVLMPNEGVDIYEYINDLDESKLLGTLNNAQSATVIATMPKFTNEYGIELKDILSELGMPTAFKSAADFSNMTDVSCYIQSVIHKTKISVDELGTRAGAATIVSMNKTSAPEDIYTVTVDRPFMYMIIDNTTNLPLFIGAMTSIAE